LIESSRLKKLEIMSSAAPATEKHPLSLLTATLVKSATLSPDVRLLTLRAEGKDPLSFLPGQCIRVEQELEGKLVPLLYSIASPPRSNNYFELCVKPGRKGSPADHLCSARVGSQLRISRPQGGFVLQESRRAALFLAAGTGIAPIRSMLHWLVETNEQRQLCLVFGARNAESLIFHDEFVDLARRYSNFQYIPVLSRPNAEWDGANGYVQHHLKGISGVEDARVYLCGPPAMVASANRSLDELGWSEDQIHYERHGH
jgi:ferredoxin-NADP reductase